MLGSPRSGGAWFSGVWAGGGTISAARVTSFGVWRGAPTDAAITYPESKTWEQIYGSDWHISTFNDFEGILVYGLPMLPANGDGDLQSISSGAYDWVYTKVASDLVKHGRGRSIVRIGWEANGDWWPWNAQADSADAYVAAFRHIVGVLRSVAPQLVIDFDVNCGTTLRGQSDRLDTLTQLYPGDDAVDLIGCDHYDWNAIEAIDDAGWERAKHPKDSVGVQDVADFARARGKGLTLPEWGLASPQEHGNGDNPFFMQKMRGFFEDNKDVLVLEDYFSEPETSLGSGIWDPEQNPQSAEEYQKLW
jgi:hypothetical protein